MLVDGDADAALSVQRWRTVALLAVSLNFVALAALGWLAWDTRAHVASLESSAGDAVEAAKVSDRPDWAWSIQSSADDAAEQAKRAADAAEEAKQAAEAACRKIDGFSIGC